MRGDRLTGKVAIITGASRGIGRAIAERFSDEGAKVVVDYASSGNEARQVVEGIRKRGGDAIAVQADVSRSAEVTRLTAATMEAYGRIDILVNNAGVWIAKEFFDITEDEWDRTLDVNLKGAYLCSKSVAPIMLQQQGGTILLMSSISGLYVPDSMRYPEYVASKAGVSGLAKSLAILLGPSIRVNALCPGRIETDMTAGVDPETVQRVLAETPLARSGTPRDVADAAVFLASDEAAFITGELLIVAGGRGMH